MSMVIRFRCSELRANQVPPSTPPAGPERIKLTGASIAASTVMAPPPERVIKNWPVNPLSANEPFNFVK